MKENILNNIYKTNEGYNIKVLEYLNAHKIKIKFLDDYGFEKYVQKSQLKLGTIKNPYHRSVFGVGMLGVLKNGTIPKTKKQKTIVKEYALWHRMLSRCYYDDKNLNRKYYYQKVKVCERWLVFANFLEDIVKIKDYEKWKTQEGYELDKDMLGNGKNIYSLETCCFLSSKENTKEMNKRAKPSEKNKKKIIGVNIETNQKIYFDSIIEAKEYGFNPNNISNCCNGRRKTHKGYLWSFYPSKVFENDLENLRKEWESTIQREFED